MEWWLIDLAAVVGLVAGGRYIMTRRRTHREADAELAGVRRLADEDVTQLGEELSRFDGESPGFGPGEHYPLPAGPVGMEVTGSRASAQLSFGGKPLGSPGARRGLVPRRYASPPSVAHRSIETRMVRKDCSGLFLR